MHKTKEEVTIPIIDQASKFINKGFDNQKVFNVYTDQSTNKYLKDIMTLAGIKKHISFHCARHTFATMGISKGMRIEIIQKILGHKDLKTTAIYAKIDDPVKHEEMKKLGT